MTPLHMMLAVLVSLLWGLNFIAAKIALGHFPIFLMLALRLLIVAFVILPFVKRPNISWNALWLISFTMAVFNTALGYGALRLGLDTSVAILIDQLRVPLAVLLGIIVLKENVRWKTSLGILITFVGTFFIIKSPQNIGNMLGLLCSFGGALGWAFYNLQIKQLGKIDVFALLGILCLMGSFQLFLFSLFFESNHLQLLVSASWQQISGIVYLALGGTIIGQGLWFYLLHRYDVSEVTPFSLLVSFFGIISSTLILGETLTWQLIVGGIIVISGIAIIVLRRPQVVEIGENT